MLNDDIDADGLCSEAVDVLKNHYGSNFRTRYDSDAPGADWHWMDGIHLGEDKYFGVTDQWQRHWILAHEIGTICATAMTRNRPPIGPTIAWTMYRDAPAKALTGIHKEVTVISRGMLFLILPSFVVTTPLDAQEPELLATGVKGVLTFLQGKGVPSGDVVFLREVLLDGEAVPPGGSRIGDEWGEPYLRKVREDLGLAVEPYAEAQECPTPPMTTPWCNFRPRGR